MRTRTHIICAAVNMAMLQDSFKERSDDRAHRQRAVLRQCATLLFVFSTCLLDPHRIRHPAAFNNLPEQL
jgi:hypothetical protein